MRVKGRDLWSTIEQGLSVLEQHVRAYQDLQSAYERLKAEFERLSETDEPFPPALELGRDVKGFIKEQVSRIG